MSDKPKASRIEILQKQLDRLLDENRSFAPDDLFQPGLLEAHRLRQPEIERLRKEIDNARAETQHHVPAQSEDDSLIGAAVEFQQVRARQGAMGAAHETHFSVPQSLGQNPFPEGDARHGDWQQFGSDTLKGLHRLVTKLHDLTDVTDAASYSAWRSKYLEFKLPDNYDQQMIARMNQDQAHWIILYFNDAADHALRAFADRSEDLGLPNRIIEHLAGALRATIGARSDDSVTSARVTHWTQSWLERARLDSPPSSDEFAPLTPRDKWFLPDANLASDTPAFFQSVKSHRLDAIATLRQEMQDIAEKSRPKTTDELYRALLPAIVSYAEDLFGASAEARLQDSQQSHSYENWLDACGKAVIVDCCDGMWSQFPTAVGLLTESNNERQKPETFRAAIGLWSTWNPFSSSQFPNELKNYLGVRLKTQTSLRWLAKAHGGAAHNRNHPPKESSQKTRPAEPDVAAGKHVAPARAGVRDRQISRAPRQGTVLSGRGIPRILPVTTPRIAIEYPADLPEQARKRVFRAQVLAVGVFEEKKSTIRSNEDRDALLLSFMLQVFTAFAKEVLDRGHRGIKAAERCESECLDFLLESARPLHLTDAGKIRTDIQASIEGSPEWREFRRRLREVADAQAADEPTSSPKSEHPSSRNVQALRYPNRAEWLQDELALRDWNVHELQAQGGPNWKTTRKVLDGLHVSRGVLEKIVIALSAKKKKVIFSGVPQD
jgi:hypothetical protein